MCAVLVQARVNSERWVDMQSIGARIADGFDRALQYRIASLGVFDEQLYFSTLIAGVCAVTSPLCIHDLLR